MTLSRVRELAKLSLDANWLLLALVGAHVAAALILSTIYDFEIRLGLTWQLGFFLASYVVVGCLMLLWRLSKRPENPVQDILREWRGWRLPERMVVAAPALVALSLFGSSFGALKSAIPAMQPYVWDSAFADWDVAIHGADAWKVIQPLVGYPIVTSGLNGLYHIWLLLFNCALAVACATVPSGRLRNQFLIAFVLCWALVGNLAATLLASVGPCFMAPMFGDFRYEPLMGYLRGVAESYPVQALVVQDMLLADAKAGAAGLGRGISAMPSMHVSISTLMALGAWRISRALGWAATAFAATILLGSVHLGYHYAVDGYVAIALTSAIWVLSGYLASWRPRRLSPSLSEARAFDV